jgi:hypothetical protein
LQRFVASFLAVVIGISWLRELPEKSVSHNRVVGLMKEVPKYEIHDFEKIEVEI